MASMTMTASLFGCATSTIVKQPSSNIRRNLMVVQAIKGSDGQNVSLEWKNPTKMKEENSSGRRDLMFAIAAAAVAACSIDKVAMADEPKRGTPDAKKKYGPICVTMPTARICNR